MVTLLGGRAAEEEVFDESYSGASDDLSRVQLVCKQMVGEFGMGVALDHDGPPPIAMPTGDYAVSDATRRDVDVAAMTLAREAYRRARALLVRQPPVPRRPRRQRARARDADPRGTRRDLRRATTCAGWSSRTAPARLWSLSPGSGASSIVGQL